MILTDLLDVSKLNAHVQNGLVGVQYHPVYPQLAIYNYTPEAQFSRAWDDVTTKCRGLIVDAATGEIVARPFPKFFNLPEHDAQDPVLQAPFTVFDKADGSLGILVEGYGDPFIATRGSFQSDQAIWATNFYRKYYTPTDYYRFGAGVTALFEIIYPDNRIIVDYGDKEELVLLAVIDNETGCDLDGYKGLWPGEVVQQFNPEHTTPDAVLSQFQREGAEGVVLRFDYNGSHVRIKVKQEDYIALHRTKYAASLRQLREAWLNGKDHEYIAALPDEIHGEFKDEVRRLDELLAKVRGEVYYDLEQTTGQYFDTRKDMAAFVKTLHHPGLVFSLIDGYDVNWREYVLKKIKDKK